MVFNLLAISEANS